MSTGAAQTTGEPFDVVHSELRAGDVWTRPDGTEITIERVTSLGPRARFCWVSSVTPNTPQVSGFDVLAAALRGARRKVHDGR